MATDLNALRTQWETTGALLARWRNRARLSQHAHWESAKRYERLNYWIGIPTIVLTGVVGTTVFATLQKQVEFRIQLLVGGISVLAAVLAGLQTFLGFSKRAEQHKAAAAAYSAIRRRLETAATLPIELRGNLAETVKEVERDLDALATTAPTVAGSIFRAVSALLAADPDTWPEARSEFVGSDTPFGPRRHDLNAPEVHAPAPLAGGQQQASPNVGEPYQP